VPFSDSHASGYAAHAAPPPARPVWRYARIGMQAEVAAHANLSAFVL